MTLHVSVQDPARTLDVDFEVASGTVTAILGPNGAGKSTILDVVAGVHTCANRVVLDGDDISKRATYERSVALLDQDATLFPHLNVLDNVAFSPRCRGASKPRARAAAREWLDVVGMGDFAQREPAQLSGGQAQRVAIARALAAEPEVILLDEPMAALDTTAVPEIRAVLRNVLHSTTALLVTHDPLDALTLADSAVVIEHGRVAEQGPVREVLTSPRSAFAARLAGINFITGRIDAEGDLESDRGTVVGVPDGPLASGAAAVAVFSPAAVAVFLSRPTGSPRNVFAVTIEGVEPTGSGVRVHAGSLHADVSLSSAAELDLTQGTRVHFVVKAAETRLYTLLGA